MGKGRYRFRAFKLSEMMPNSWFYKLRDMGSKRSRKVQIFMEKGGQIPIMETGISFENPKPGTKSPENQAYIRNRESYYIPSVNRVEKIPFFSTHPKATDTHLPSDKPRENRTKPRKKPLIPHNKLISSSVSSLLRSEPAREIPPQNFKNELITTDSNLSIPLPPIVTKPVKKENQSSKQGSFNSHAKMRSFTPQTPRIKIRINSPKLMKKRLREKKGLADSFVVVKLSSDPESDFRESMLEMIVQNNLWDSKDLEELLSCYLYLNSDEYHDLIVKAFRQIWFDLSVINLQSK